LIAASLASEPEFAKNTLSIPEISQMRSAARSCSGTRKWFEMCMSFATWSQIARVSTGCA